MKFTEILDSHGISYRVEGKHTRPGWIQLEICPLCQGEWYLGYNSFFGYMNCWRCGGLNTNKILALLLNQSFHDAKTLLADVDKEREPEQYTRKGLVIPNGVGPLLPVHKSYLKGRGFDPTELESLWGIKGIGLAAKLSWRIWIPFEHDKQTVSWTTRSVSNSVASRYVSASPQEEAMNAKKLLFGMDFVRHSTIVVEGPFDCFRIGPGSVGTLGVGVSRGQVSKLARIASRAICFDSEPKAQARARRLAESLSSYPGKTRIVEIDAADPSELKPKDVQLLRKELLR